MNDSHSHWQRMAFLHDLASILEDALATSGHAFRMEIVLPQESDAFCESTSSKEYDGR